MKAIIQGFTSKSRHNESGISLQRLIDTFQRMC